MEGFKRAWTQVFPPAPSFTEQSIGDLSGRVYFITGGNMGVGKEVARVLYSKHATVYLGCRSEARALAAIADIEAAHPDARGRLAYQHVDLADLATIAASSRAFAAHEPRLHVLFNNAGLSMPPAGSVSAQGYELQLATNNLGPFLLTKLLTPTLVATARDESKKSQQNGPTTTSSPVRVVWLSSSAMENFAHRPGGVPVDLLLQKGGREAFVREVGQAAYGVTKAGNYLHSCEYARRHRADGVVSVAVNPGNLHTGIMRHLEGPLNVVVRAVAGLVMYPALYGAYTELWAGLSDEVTLESSGSWIVPWGRFLGLREDLLAAAKTEQEGGTGAGEKFWDWCEEQVAPYI